MVWGIAREQLFSRIGEFQGFRRCRDDLVTLAREWEGLGEFRPRPEAEQDPSFQQIIPYIALTHRGQMLLLRRLTTQGEARLHERFSVGIGGHINPEPPGQEPLVIRGLRRELREEMELEHTPLPQLLGFVNDDASEVGSVHFGLCCALELAEPVAIREVDRMEGAWVQPAAIREHYSGLESWSQMFFDGALSEEKSSRT